MRILIIFSKCLLAQKEQKPYTKREREGNGPAGKLEAVIAIVCFEMAYVHVPTCTHIVKNDNKF